MRLFLSHASSDSAVARQLVEQLEAAGLSVWYAPRDARPGREYGAEIIGGIEGADALVLLHSAAADRSAFVRREVERAVAKDKRVYPVRLQRIPPGRGLELFVSGAQWIEAWDRPPEEAGRRLIAAIQGDSQRAPTLVVPPPGTRPAAPVGARPGGRPWPLATIFAAGLALAAAIVIVTLWLGVDRRLGAPPLEPIVVAEGDDPGLAAPPSPIPEALAPQNDTVRRVISDLRQPLPPLRQAVDVPGDSQAALCAALTRVVAAAPEGFVPILGETLGSGAWRPAIGLPGANCRVTAGRSSVLTCRYAGLSRDQLTPLRARVAGCVAAAGPGAPIRVEEGATYLEISVRGPIGAGIDPAADPGLETYIRRE